MSLSGKKLSEKRAKKAKKQACRKKKASNQVGHFQERRISSERVITYMNKNFEDIGLGICILVRNTNDGYKHVTSVLVDTQRLGVKDIHVEEFSERGLDDYLSSVPGGLMPVMNGYMLQFINGAIDYARSLGNEPHKTYKKYKKYLRLHDDSDEYYDFSYGSIGDVDGNIFMPSDDSIYTEEEMEKSEIFCTSFKAGEAYLAFYIGETDLLDGDSIYCLVDLYSGYWFSYNGELNENDDDCIQEVQSMLNSAYEIKNSKPKYLYMEFGDEYKDIFSEVALSHGIVFREGSPRDFISVTNRIRECL